MKQCDRCKEWEQMGLSSTCPACDEIMLSKEEQQLKDDFRVMEGDDFEPDEY